MAIRKDPRFAGGLAAPCPSTPCTPKFGHPKFGLGLRRPHYAEVLAGGAPLDFVEVISENFMVPGGRPRDVLRRARTAYPVALHGVSMSPGSAEGIDRDYLLRLKALVEEVEPIFVSDHLCWTRAGAFQSHDLLPLPYTDEALKVVAANVARAQDMLGRQMLIENPSSYVAFTSPDMHEWEFLSELSRRTGCGLLLDINNIFVSASNHGWNALDYLDGLPLDKVCQIHLAGHTSRVVDGHEMLVDTHDRPVPDGVWVLFAETMKRLAAVGASPWVMIERDGSIPPLAELLDELATARDLAKERIAA